MPVFLSFSCSFPKLVSCLCNQFFFFLSDNFLLHVQLSHSFYPILGFVVLVPPEQLVQSSQLRKVNSIFLVAIAIIIFYLCSLLLLKVFVIFFPEVLGWSPSVLCFPSLFPDRFSFPLNVKQILTFHYEHSQQSAELMLIFIGSNKSNSRILFSVHMQHICIHVTLKST